MYDLSWASFCWIHGAVLSDHKQQKVFGYYEDASIFRVVLTITLIVKDGQLLDECNVLEIQTLFSVLCLLPRFDVDHCQHLGTALFLFSGSASSHAVTLLMTIVSDSIL